MGRLSNRTFVNLINLEKNEVAQEKIIITEFRKKTLLHKN